MVWTRRGYLARVGGFGTVGTGVVLGGCSERDRRSRALPDVRVGSKPFPEQQVLGYLAYERLQSVSGIQAVDEIGYGNTRENWRATVDGVKHLYWEYTGTAWRELPPRHDRRVTDPERLSELVAADARDRGIRMAAPASFSNGYVLVADREWSERTGVSTTSEFATRLADGNTDVGVAFNEDFYHRRDGWTGLADYYGVPAETRAAVESGTFVVTSVGLTYELLSEGRAQVASGFATDPQIDRRSLVVLDDDREYFVPYQPAPTAHAPTIEAHPAVFDALEPVVTALDEATIRRLNGRVVLGDHEPRTVAQSYLAELGPWR